MSFISGTVKPAVLAFLTVLTLAPAACAADIYIGVAGGADEGRIKLGLRPFEAERAGVADDAAEAAKFHEIIRADLLYSRYFSVPDAAAPEDSKKLKKILAAWEKTGVRYLVTGTAANLGNLWTLTARVYDLASGEAVVEKYYKGEPASLRRAAHLFADEVVWRITGKKGIAHTRIAFANDSSGSKEIYLADYDGQSFLRLTSDKSISLFPRWSPDGMKLYYTTWRYRNPDAFEIDLQARTVKPVSFAQGLNIPDGVSPEGDKLVLTLSRNNNPSIYEMDLASKELKRLTRSYGVDSSAAYSPDGKFITFVSDRSGNPQVYIMELATGKPQRLTRLNWCDTPRWSPSGDWIAFAGRAERKDPMDIFLVDITGGQLRQLTRDAGSNEDPTWSPDGRFIAFTSTRDGKDERRIYVMDADGSAPHAISNLTGKSYTPAWGP